MLINQIRIFGNTESVLECPPPIVMEFYDKDNVVSTIVCTCTFGVYLYVCIYVSVLGMIVHSVLVHLHLCFLGNAYFNSTIALTL